MTFLYLFGFFLFFYRNMVPSYMIITTPLISEITFLASPAFLPACLLWGTMLFDKTEKEKKARKEGGRGK